MVRVSFRLVAFVACLIRDHMRVSRRSSVSPAEESAIANREGRTEDIVHSRLATCC